MFGNNVVDKMYNKFVPLHIKKADGRVQLQIYSFLTPAPDGGGWSASGSDKSTPHPPKQPVTIRKLRGTAERVWRRE